MSDKLFPDKNENGQRIVMTEEELDKLFWKLLSVRAYNTLRNSRIHSLWDLLNHTENSIKKRNSRAGAGNKFFKEIRFALAQLGLSLQADPVILEPLNIKQCPHCGFNVKVSVRIHKGK